MQTALPRLSVRLALLLAAVCVVFLMIGSWAGADTQSAPPQEYVVEIGDTLWGIAAEFSEPGADLRHFVSDIIRVSRVDKDVIFPGQVLLIPTG